MSSRNSLKDMDSILHVDNNSSGSFPSEEFSLLNEVGDGLYPNGDTNNVNFDFTNMHSTLNEIAQDPNTEVSSLLTKLISDNLSLKEALDKNNSMMKEQLSTIPAWRDLMILKTQQQQQNLQVAKEKMSSLEKENNNLRKKLDNLLAELCQSKEIKDFCTKCETLESTLYSLFGEKDFIKKDNSIFCSELNKFHENLEQNLIAICHHLNVMLNSKMDEKEKNVLKTFIILLKLKIASLNGSIYATVQTDEETGYEIVQQMANKEESVRENSRVSSDICKKLADLEESLKKKVEEVMKTEESLKKKDDELNICRNEKDQLSEKLKIYDLKIQDLERASKAQFELLSGKLNFESSVSEKYKERCESLQQHIDEYQVKLDRAKMSDDHNTDELRQEIRNLQEILKMEQRANQRDKEELSRVMIKCEKLQVDYDRVTKLLEVVSRDEKEKIEKLQTLQESNEKGYCEQIDRLTAQLFEVQDQLDESNAAVRELKEKLSLVEEESENIPALQAEILVHRKDLMSSITACKSAEEEVERLNKELEKYQRKSNSSSGNSSPASSRHHLPLTSTKDRRNGEEPIVCPICGNQFTNMRAANNHIDRCLEENK